MPTAEFDGKTLSGNATISRYLAEEHGECGIIKLVMLLPISSAMVSLTCQASHDGDTFFSLLGLMNHIEWCQMKKIITPVVVSKCTVVR